MLLLTTRMYQLHALDKKKNHFFLLSTSNNQIFFSSCVLSECFRRGIVAVVSARVDTARVDGHHVKHVVVEHNDCATNVAVIVVVVVGIRWRIVDSIELHAIVIVVIIRDWQCTWWLVSCVALHSERASRKRRSSQLISREAQCLFLSCFCGVAADQKSCAMHAVMFR